MVTTTMDCFHYELCVNLVNQVYLLPVINRSVINIHSCILTGVLHCAPHSARSSLLVDSDVNKAISLKTKTKATESKTN